MEELIKSINDLIKEVRTLTALVSCLLQSEETGDELNYSDDQAPKTYLDGTPIAK